jgi:hypothetical protein
MARQRDSSIRLRCEFGESKGLRCLARIHPKRRDHLVIRFHIEPRVGSRTCPDSAREVKGARIGFEIQLDSGRASGTDSPRLVFFKGSDLFCRVSVKRQT